MQEQNHHSRKHENISHSYIEHNSKFGANFRPVNKINNRWYCTLLGQQILTHSKINAHVQSVLTKAIVNEAHLHIRSRANIHAHTHTVYYVHLNVYIVVAPIKFDR